MTRYSIALGKKPPSPQAKKSPLTWNVPQPTPDIVSSLTWNVPQSSQATELFSFYTEMEYIRRRIQSTLGITWPSTAPK